MYSAYAINEAIKETAKGNIVTLGIPPARAETGFGYIKTEKCKLNLALKVLKFVEKPDRKTAENFLKEGNYFWNSGIFCFRLKDILNALITHFPECGIPAEKGMCCLIEAFSSISSISIDYAVMEKAKNITCIPLTPIGQIWDHGMLSGKILEKIKTTMH